MLSQGEGVSEVRPGTLYRPLPRPTWPAVCFTSLAMSASCLSTLPVLESLLEHERLMQLTLDRAAIRFPYRPHLPTFALAATLQKN